MSGADAEDLERGGSRLESFAGQIGGMRQPLRNQLRSSPWNGRSADRFRSEWDTVHSPALAEAEEFLRHAGQRLRAEADQQRRASGSGAGGRRPGSAAGGGGGAGWESSAEGPLEEVKDLLEKLGIPHSKIAELLKILGVLDDIGMLTGPLKALADNEALAGMMSAVGSGLSLADMALEFISTVVDNPSLPMDERVVLATATVAVGFAVKAGTKAVSEWMSTAIVSFVGGGPVVGYVVGKAVGYVAGEAAEAADDQFNISENAAQATLDAYRYAKERDFDPGRILVDGVGDAVEGVIDTAQDFAGDVASAINPWD